MVETSGKPCRMWTRDFMPVCLANLFLFLAFFTMMPVLPLYVQHIGGSNLMVGLVSGIATFQGFGWGVASTAAATTPADLIPPRARRGNGLFCHVRRPFSHVSDGS